MSDIRVRHLKNVDYCDFCLEEWPCDAICETDRADKSESNLRDTLWLLDSVSRELRYIVRDWIEIVGDEDENKTPANRLEKAKQALSETVGILNQPWAQAILKENK